MNDAQKRRQRLLEETRARYQDDYLPAVHPRYRSVYSDLYGSEREEVSSTFRVRCLCCALILSIFIAADQSGQKLFDMSSQHIAEEISKDMRKDVVKDFDPVKLFENYVTGKKEISGS